ncbi:hypothetical protein B7494_g5481 [Chlorociboria aeruginascens]|nr:hypothetical protein B7494_g5481 [Chlorociboria aeruginascens]
MADILSTLSTMVSHKKPSTSQIPITAFPCSSSSGQETQTPSSRHTDPLKQLVSNALVLYKDKASLLRQPSILVGHSSWTISGAQFFFLFGRLPPELRLQIWGETLPGRRTIDCGVGRVEGLDPVTGVYHLRGPPVMHQAADIPIMRVSQEARMVARAYYRCGFDDENPALYNQFYYNPSIDIVNMEGWTERDIWDSMRHPNVFHRQSIGAVCIGHGFNPLFSDGRALARNIGSMVLRFGSLENLYIVVPDVYPNIPQATFQAVQNSVSRQVLSTCHNTGWPIPNPPQLIYIRLSGWKEYFL